jgi:hypothetical protein
MAEELLPLKIFYKAVLEKILKTYKVSLESDVSFDDILNLHNKVRQVIDYLEE